MSTEEWAVGYDEGYMKGWNDAMDEKPAEASDPVAYIEHHKAGDNLVWDNPGVNSTSLYQFPPTLSLAQHQSRSDLKPLTDEQREEIAKGWRGRNWTVGDIIDAIEAAHGIYKEEN